MDCADSDNAVAFDHHALGVAKSARQFRAFGFVENINRPGIDRHAAAETARLHVHAGDRLVGEAHGDARRRVTVHRGVDIGTGFENLRVDHRFARRGADPGNLLQPVIEMDEPVSFTPSSARRNICTAMPWSSGSRTPTWPQISPISHSRILAGDAQVLLQRVLIKAELAIPWFVSWNSPSVDIRNYDAAFLRAA